MSNTQNRNVVSIGFPGLLTLIFITLKLCGVITWSWIWVLAPFWISLVLTFGIIAALLLGAGICALVVYLLERK